MIAYAMCAALVRRSTFVVAATLFAAASASAKATGTERMVTGSEGVVSVREAVQSACEAEHTIHELNGRRYCLRARPEPVMIERAPGNLHAVFWPRSRFDEGTIVLPTGVSDVRVIAAPYRPVATESLRPSPIPGADMFVEGRFSSFVPRDLTFNGERFSLSCRAALSPKRDENGDRACYLNGAVDENWMTSVLVYLSDDPAFGWPHLEGGGLAVWQPLLDELAVSLHQFIEEAR